MPKKKQQLFLTILSTSPKWSRRLDHNPALLAAGPANPMVRHVDVPSIYAAVILCGCVAALLPSRVSVVGVASGRAFGAVVAVHGPVAI